MLTNKTISVGRFYACFASQAAGSPLVDKCATLETDEPKRIGFGWLIRLPFTGDRPTIGLTLGKWHKVGVQACRPEDRAMLATPEGGELIRAAVSAMSNDEAPNAEVSRSAPLLAQVGSTDGLVATRHGED